MASALEKEARIPYQTMNPPHTTNGHSNGHTGKDEAMPSRASNSSNVDPLESDSVLDVKPENGASDLEQNEPPKTELEKSKAKTALLMFALCMAVFLAALDVTIITTALPTIAQYFKSSSGFTWIGSAYLLGSAASVPIWAKFSDIFGRKPILLGANLVFFVGSLVAALSNSIGMLITARGVQGVGGGGLLTLVNISIGDLFSMRTRGMYYGIVGFVWAVASAVGPLLGGAFTQKLTWRWCFWINLPFQGIAFVIIIIWFKIHTPKTPIGRGLLAIDWLGSLLIVGGIIMFLMGLEYGGAIHPWGSTIVICLLVFGVFTFTLFVINEWKFAKYPIIPLHIFQNRSNIAVFICNYCHGFVFIGATFFLPLYFQTVLGYGPIMSGVLLLAMVLPLSFASMFSGFFIRKTGNYLWPIWFGLFFQTVGFGLFINFGANPGLARIIVFQMIAGLGTGPNFQAPLIALQSMTEPRDIGSVVSLFQLVRNVATSMSVVIGAVVFQNALKTHEGTLRAALGDEIAGRLSGFNAAASGAFIKSLPVAQKEIANVAFAAALQKMWIMYVCFPAFGLLASFFVRKRVLSKVHEQTKTGLEAEEEKRADREDAKQARRESKAARKSLSTRGGDTPLASPRAPLTSPRSPKIHENGVTDRFGKEEV